VETDVAVGPDGVEVALTNGDVDAGDTTGVANAWCPLSESPADPALAAKDPRHIAGTGS
jgi:hypothetical protein